MTAVEIDDPVADVLRWQLANQRREALWQEFKRQRELEREKELYQRIVEPAGKSCHYCDAPATTRDHIVPRSKLRLLAHQFTYLSDTPNIVPACQPCNQRKSDLRSDCTCPRCCAAWAAYGPVEDS
jgi:5-methylcytosine-specific restriction endonuclease McrA